MEEQLGLITRIDRQEGTAMSAFWIKKAGTTFKKYVSTYCNGVCSMEWRECLLALRGMSEDTQGTSVAYNGQEWIEQ